MCHPASSITMPARDDRLPASVTPPRMAEAVHGGRSRSPLARALSEPSSPPSQAAAPAYTAPIPPGARKPSRPSRWDRGKPGAEPAKARSPAGVRAAMQAAAYDSQAAYQLHPLSPLQQDAAEKVSRTYSAPIILPHWYKTSNFQPCEA